MESIKKVKMQKELFSSSSKLKQSTHSAQSGIRLCWQSFASSFFEGTGTETFALMPSMIVVHAVYRTMGDSNHDCFAISGLHCRPKRCNPHHTNWMPFPTLAGMSGIALNFFTQTKELYGSTYLWSPPLSPAGVVLS